MFSLVTCIWWTYLIPGGLPGCDLIVNNCKIDFWITVSKKCCLVIPAMSVVIGIRPSTSTPAWQSPSLSVKSHPLNKLAEIAQLVEHATENRSVVSSILSLGTLILVWGKIRGCSSVVERLLAKEKVEGSNPFARSSIEDCRLMPAYRQSTILNLIIVLASWPSGKAWVCKTLITGSNPVDAS